LRDQLQSFPARGDGDGNGDGNGDGVGHGGAKVRGQSHLWPLCAGSGDKTPSRANGLSMPGSWLNSCSNKLRYKITFVRRGGAGGKGLG